MAVNDVDVQKRLDKEKFLEVVGLQFDVEERLDQLTTITDCDLDLEMQERAEKVTTRLAKLVDQVRQAITARW